MTETTLLTQSPPAAADSLHVDDCSDREAWANFVADRAGIYHRWEWGEVFARYGLPVRRLAAFQGNQIVGILPLVQQRSLLFGRHWVSLPWFDAVGVIAATEESVEMLVDAATQLAEETDTDTVQIRQSQACGLSRHCRTDKVLMRLELPADPEQLWSSLKPKVRNQVRKGEKSGLSVSAGGAERLSAFYRVYSQNMRDLGSPSHSEPFFSAVCEAFADEIRIWTVNLDGQTVGAGFTIANGSILEIPWASSLRDFNRCCVNHAMYWQILKAACEEGFGWFHFGRSTVGSGTYRFKEQWGARPLPLFWYFLGKDSVAAEAATDPGESFGLARRLWRRLPTAVTRQLGPHLISKLA